MSRLWPRMQALNERRMVNCNDWRDTTVRLKVQWQVPSGRQWGHPFHPIVEYLTNTREFGTRAEATAFAAGLTSGNVRGIKIEEPGT